MKQPEVYSALSLSTWISVNPTDVPYFIKYEKAEKDMTNRGGKFSFFSACTSACCEGRS